MLLCSDQYKTNHKKIHIECKIFKYLKYIKQLEWFPFHTWAYIFPSFWNKVLKADVFFNASSEVILLHFLYPWMYAVPLSSFPSCHLLWSKVWPIHRHSHVTTSLPLAGRCKLCVKCKDTRSVVEMFLTYIFFSNAFATVLECIHAADDICW